MILRRMGTKYKIAHKILPFFPQHRYYVELFFGAGGMFFSKPNCGWNLLNDNDAEVINLYTVLSTHRAEFEAELDITPNHSDLFHHWVSNVEHCPIRRAVRFIFLSNFSLYGAGTTQKIPTGNNPKKSIREQLPATINLLRDCTFTNYDFRDVLSKIGFKHSAQSKEQTFIYADPPYCATGSNYDGFSEKDTRDLFGILAEAGCKFAISEFQNEFILTLAKEFDLQVHYISERRTLKSRNVEILLTNYSSTKSLF